MLHESTFAFYSFKSNEEIHSLMTCAIRDEKKADAAKDSECDDCRRSLKIGFADNATSSLWTTLMLELNDEWFLLNDYIMSYINDSQSFHISNTSLTC